MVGIPPFILFTSKLYLAWGASEVGQQLFMIVYLVSGVLAAGYLFPIVVRAFFRAPVPLPPSPVAADGSLPLRYREADIRMVAPLAVTGVVSLFLGIAPNQPFGFYDLALRVAEAAYGAVDVLVGVGP